MIFSIEIRKSPFIRILVPFITGIWIVNSIPGRNYQLIAMLFLMVCCLVLWSSKFFFPKKSVWFSGACIYLMFGLMGMSIYILSIPSTFLPNCDMNYSGIVYSSPNRNKNSVSVDCMITGFEHRGMSYRAGEKVRLYMAAENDMNLLHIGDSIHFHGKLQAIRNQGNPGEFDFANYMRNQGIVYSGFVREEDLKMGNQSGRYFILELAAGIQQSIISKIEKYKITGDESAVLTALVAGDRQFIGGELKESYAAAGVMHILAVSGLHVGILYLFLSILLFRNNKQLFFRLLRLTIILSGIWGYAFITGLSSSVLRASVMFSLFLIGKSFNRPVNSYNILAASAMLILVFNPMQLFRVGFQFSYLAVFGIIFFQPRLETLLLIRNPVIDRIWQLVTVSVAAQITTFPLSLYYFHQFPLYFWLSNIVVIPAVWLVMIIALLFFMFSAVNPIASFLAICLKGLLFVLNQTVGLISFLPYAVIENIRFRQLHLIGFMLIVLAIILIVSFYKIKRNIYFIISALTLVLFINVVDFRSKESSRELILYNLRNNSAISMIDGHEHVLLVESCDTGWVENRRYLKNYWLNREVYTNRHELCLSQFPTENMLVNHKGILMERRAEGIYIDLHDLSMLLLTKQAQNNSKETTEAFKVDMLLVTAYSGYPRVYHQQFIDPGKLVIMGGMNRGMQSAWKEFAHGRDIEIYSTNDSGALHIIF